MRTQIDDALFDEICDHLSSCSDSLHTALEKYDTTTYMFYKVVGSDKSKSEQYMQARSKYVENKLSERSRIMEKAMNDAKSLPRSANAIVAAAKEQCRIIEWDCEKLLPKVYGTKIDVGDNIMKVTLINQNKVENSTVDSTL
jgi:hypothetical protein